MGKRVGVGVLMPKPIPLVVLVGPIQVVVAVVVLIIKVIIKGEMVGLGLW